MRDAVDVHGETRPNLRTPAQTRLRGWIVVVVGIQLFQWVQRSRLRCVFAPTDPPIVFHWVEVTLLDDVCTGTRIQDS